MADANESPERRIPRPLEKAEALAIKAMTLGRGCHPLDPSTGYSEVCVDFNTRDLHQALVILFSNGHPMYAFNIDLKVESQHPSPEELWDSQQEDGKEPSA